MNFEILIVSLVSYISFYDTYLFPLSFFFYRFDAFVSKGIVTTRATDLSIFFYTKLQLIFVWKIDILQF